MMPRVETKATRKDGAVLTILRKYREQRASQRALWLEVERRHEASKKTYYACDYCGATFEQAAGETVDEACRKHLGLHDGER